MRTAGEVRLLLDDLNTLPADDLEDQDLDFKEWIGRSRNDALKQIVEYAICMANGGGGTVVFGVRDHTVGRDRTIIGVPPEIDTKLLKKAVYDSTDPKLTPVFEDLQVPEGTGRLILMQVHPGIPPYTDTGGHGKIRIGKPAPHRHVAAADRGGDRRNRFHRQHRPRQP
ncbi:MAG: ATP-dependent helicase RecG [Methanofollis sp.]|nr:ATP-dependent helicase RecG [Methanofollis sp.]